MQSLFPTCRSLPAGMLADIPDGTRIVIIRYAHPAKFEMMIG
jgi:hypothetical protein